MIASPTSGLHKPELTSPNHGCNQSAQVDFSNCYSDDDPEESPAPSNPPQISDPAPLPDATPLSFPFHPPPPINVYETDDLPQAEQHTANNLEHETQNTLLILKSHMPTEDEIQIDIQAGLEPSRDSQIEEAIAEDPPTVEMSASRNNSVCTSYSNREFSFKDEDEEAGPAGERPQYRDAPQRLHSESVNVSYTESRQDARLPNAISRSVAVDAGYRHPSEERDCSTTFHSQQSFGRGHGHQIAEARTLSMNAPAVTQSAASESTKHQQTVDELIRYKMASEEFDKDLIAEREVHSSELETSRVEIHNAKNATIRESNAEQVA